MSIIFYQQNLNTLCIEHIIFILAVYSFKERFE